MRQHFPATPYLVPVPEFSEVGPDRLTNSYPSVCRNEGPCRNSAGGRRFLRYLRRPRVPIWGCAPNVGISRPLSANSGHSPTAWRMGQFHPFAGVRHGETAPSVGKAFVKMSVATVDALDATQGGAERIDAKVGSCGNSQCLFERLLIRISRVAPPAPRQAVGARGQA